MRGHLRKWSAWLRAGTACSRFFRRTPPKPIRGSAAPPTGLHGRKPVLRTLTDVEPIGPKKWTDVLLVAPCTGNTAAKLAQNIIDTPVTLAVKSHLRGDRPVVLAMSTNDALSGSAAAIGTLMNRRHYYFVPMRQDAPDGKPRSVVADFDRIEETIAAARTGRQIQPMLLA